MMKNSSTTAFYSKNETLSTAEELALAKAFKENADVAAKQRLIMSVFSNAMRRADYICKNNDLVKESELVSEVYVALDDALSHFDYTKGLRFFTLASCYIDKYVHNLVDREAKCAYDFDSLNVSYFYDEEDVDEVSDHIADIEDEEYFDPDHAFEVIMGVMSEKVKKRDAEMVSLQFGLGGKKQKVKDIADSYGVSTETVRLTKEKVLGILAHDYRIGNLRA